MKQYLLEPDEYINPKDGLIYCKKCSKPRQRHDTIFGRDYYIRIPCDCQKESLRTEKRIREEKEHERLVANLKADGLAWKELRNYRFDQACNLDPKTMTTLKYFSEHFRTENLPGLLLWGPPGRGKTFAAACIINAVIETGQPAIMVSFEQLLEELSSLNLSDRQAHLNHIFGQALICFDDFDLRYLTRTTTPMAVDIMNRVSHCSCPVLFTTAYTLDELEHPKTELSQKLFRLIMRRCIPLYIGGEDLIRQEQQRNLAKLQEAV